MNKNKLITIFNIIINIKNNENNIVYFSCDSDTKIFIDDIEKGVIIKKGQHSIKTKKHHDMFFDWYIDGDLIEEFLVIDFVSDEKDLIIFKSTHEVKIIETISDNNNIIINSETYFPVSFSLIKDLKFQIICQKPSQLSINFEPKRKDRKSITLLFTYEGYCKVFIDYFSGKKYLNEKRENMGLFSMKIDENIIFKFDLNHENIYISSMSQSTKKYHIKGFKNYSNILIEETWIPNGTGKYQISELKN